MNKIKNKNTGSAILGRRRLLIINYKEKFSWLEVLLKIPRLASIFKDCLILLQHKEIYVFTLTSAQLFSVLQETSTRKVVPVTELNTYCSHYGIDHTFAIFWTLKGDARLVPECYETKCLFKEISNDLRDVNNSPGMVYTSFSSLISIFSTVDTTDCVNFVSEISYNKENFDERQRQTCIRKSDNIFSLVITKKVVLSSFNKVVLQTNAYLDEIRPFTNQFQNQTAYPQQVSSEQENEGRSVIAFSNGASSLPLQSRFYSFGSHSNRGNPGSRTETSEVSNRSPNNAKYPAYIEYSERLRTYARWTHRKPDPTQLCQSGFFFTNQGDLVRCFQCGIGLKDFSEDDDPLLEHVRHFSQCPFLSEYLGRTQVSSILNQLQREDPELNRQRQLEQFQGTRPEVKFSCRHPEYQSLESRLSTFEKWPQQMIQTPELLAQAGLYYTGFEDHVRCFACDGGLKRWDPDDDPWAEHCRWFPACSFARQQKGDEYIALVQASARYENEANGTPNTSRAYDENLSSTMEQMTLRDPEFRAALDEHRETCIEMGYQLEDFNEAVQELRNKGSIKPTIEELLDSIEMIKERRRQAVEEEKKLNETPLEENQRLKSFVICMLCDRNNVNALFLPCAHHRLCMACAELLTQCPVCDRNIRQKIKTYMA